MDGEFELEAGETLSNCCAGQGAAAVGVGNAETAFPGAAGDVEGVGEVVFFDLVVAGGRVRLFG